MSSEAHDLPADACVGPAPSPEHSFELALATDLGNERPNNEDACGFSVESPTHVVFAVADGVGGYEGGELASRMAIDVTLESYREHPVSWGPAKRLFRAVQRANIEIHDRAIIVTELRRMATTLTAVSVDGGVLNAVHVGDCRLLLIRDGKITQLSKDHTVAGGRARLGLLTKEELRNHPERGTLTKSLGPELIVAADRITTPLVRGDVLVLCSDGMHTVVDEADFVELAVRGSTAEACSALIGTANERGTFDNLTVAIFRQTAETPASALPTGWRERFRKLFGA
jgi:protein phosphatase